MFCVPELTQLLDDEWVVLVMINLRKRLIRRSKNLKRLSDTDLVEMAKVGDKDAFGELYERYLDKIYSYIYYRTGNHHDAEDLTARVFFRAMAHIESYTERGV